MNDASGTVPAGSPGEKGSASSISSVSLDLSGPVFPEEYSCTGGVIKLFWCRGSRYFFHILLKENPHPSAIEVSHPGVTADHMCSLSGHKVIDLQCNF